MQRCQSKIEKCAFRSYWGLDGLCWHSDGSSLLIWLINVNWGFLTAAQCESLPVASTGVDNRLFFVECDEHRILIGQLWLRRNYRLHDCSVGFLV